MCRVATVLVDAGRKYRQEAFQHRESRLKSLCTLIEVLACMKLMRIEVLLLPAGFFCTPTEAHVGELASRVASAILLLQPRFTVALGIDGAADHFSRGPSGYPSFVYVLPPEQKDNRVFQQLSLYASQDKIATDSWGNRSATFAEGDVGLLICGECWSDGLLKKLDAARPRVLLIPAHFNVNLITDPDNGFSKLSWHLRLHDFQERTSIPVILAEHTRSAVRRNHHWGAKQAKILPLPADLNRLFTVKLVEV